MTTSESLPGLGIRVSARYLYFGTYIKLWPVDISEVYGNGKLARLGIIDVAYSMGRQIGMPILVVCDLVFALVQSYSILYEEKRFVR